MCRRLPDQGPLSYGEGVRKCLRAEAHGDHEGRGKVLRGMVKEVKKWKHYYKHDKVYKHT